MKLPIFVHHYGILFIPDKLPGLYSAESTSKPSAAGLFKRMSEL
jgi:hypothetical protein